MSDVTDGLRPQVLAAALFVSLGTLTNAVMFGALLGDATYNLQGVVESVVGVALAGGVFCLVAAQPLIVLSCSGPILIFERILFHSCQSWEVEYLELRLWIGLWSALFCLALVASDASFLLRYFSRFSVEGYTGLFCFFYIFEAFRRMVALLRHLQVPWERGPEQVAQYGCVCRAGAVTEDPSLLGPDPPDGSSVWTWNSSEFFLDDWSPVTKSECVERGGELVGAYCSFVPEVVLMCFLFFGTFFCAVLVKMFRRVPFVPNAVKKLISDFAVVVAVLIFCGVDALVGLETPKFMVPTEFKLSNPGRSWYVPVFGRNPWWMLLAAALPALLLTVLIFLEQQVTAVIVHRKENRLKKGSGLHLDLLVVAVLVAVSSFLGLPWCVAAAVLSVAHVHSLRTETGAELRGVREQRVSGLCVFLLTGLSVFMAPVFKFVPLPVLYGVHLYMGVSSLSGLQLVERLKLLLTPVRRHPDRLYLRHVALRKVHLFTVVQVLSLVVLWVLRSTVAALLFPVLILALAAVRKALSCVFSQKELGFLDDDVPEEDKRKKEDEKEDRRSSDAEEARV